MRVLGKRKHKAILPCGGGGGGGGGGVFTTLLLLICYMIFSVSILSTWTSLRFSNQNESIASHVLLGTKNTISIITNTSTNQSRGDNDVQNDRLEEGLKHSITTVQQQQRVMVVDSIMYNGEPIVPIRLAMPNEVVDRFYIIEASISFSGRPKETLFKDLNAHLFEPFQRKIHWVVCKDPKSNNNFGREKGIRAHSVQSIANDVEAGIVSHPFVVINSDADEIPNPEDIKEFQPGKKYHDIVTTSRVALVMMDFYYNLIWLSSNPWKKANTLPGDQVLKGASMEDGRRNTSPHSITTGYHLSYFLDAKGIRHKLETFSHSEFNLPEYKTDGHIQECFATGNNLWGGVNARTKWNYTQAPMVLQRFHEQICRKQNVDPFTGEVLVS